jgi:hypothetical protein
MVPQGQGETFAEQYHKLLLSSQLLPANANVNVTLVSGPGSGARTTVNTRISELSVLQSREYLSKAGRMVKLFPYCTNKQTVEAAIRRTAPLGMSALSDADTDTILAGVGAMNKVKGKFFSAEITLPQAIEIPVSFLIGYEFEER